MTRREELEALVGVDVVVPVAISFESGRDLAGFPRHFQLLLDVTVKGATLRGDAVADWRLAEYQEYDNAGAAGRKVAALLQRLLDAEGERRGEP